MIVYLRSTVHQAEKDNSTNIPNLWSNPLTIDDQVLENGSEFEEKLRRVRAQVTQGLQNTAVLWSIKTNTDSHVGYLPYLLIMKALNSSNKRFTIISDLYGCFSNLNIGSTEKDSKIQEFFDAFNCFNIGTVVRFDEIYYTKTYQKMYCHTLQSTKIVNAVQCVCNEKQPSETTIVEPTSSLISILLLLNNILYFDISCVLIGEHDAWLYKFIGSLLLENYGKTLNIIEVPNFSTTSSDEIDSLSNNMHTIRLDASRDDMYHQLRCLKSESKNPIYAYMSAIQNVFSTESSSIESDMDLAGTIDSLKREVLLSPNVHCESPIFVAVSFLTDQFQVLKTHWKKHSNSKSKCTGTGTGLDGVEGNREGYEPEIGGKFIIINWLNKEIVYTINMDAPAGFFIRSHHLYVANNRLNYISIIDLNTRIEIRRIVNKNFNCLHSIHNVDNDNILVTSTGIDAIIQTNSDGAILNDWYATEHGYTLTPKGETRYVPRDFEHHRFIYPTLHQTTHINSAIALDEEYYLATLFHQGLLIKINRRSGKSKVLLSGLHCPHGIKRFKSSESHEMQWMLCNTKRNEILFLNDHFTISHKIFLEDVHWLQDATQISNGHIIVADANNSRIIEIDPTSNTAISEFNYSLDWRIYQISDLADFQTDFVAAQINQRCKNTKESVNQ